MGGQVLTSEGKTCSLRTSFTNQEAGESNYNIKQFTGMEKIDTGEIANMPLLATKELLKPLRFHPLPASPVAFLAEQKTRPAAGLEQYRPAH